MISCIREEKKKDPSYSFIYAVYENELAEYELIHSWMDSAFPEPAWKRKRQPIYTQLELKFFAVLIYLLNYSDQLKNCFTHLIQDEVKPPIPPEFRDCWRVVLTLREHLRKKKQEFIHMSTINIERAASVAVLPSRKSSFNILHRSDSSQFSLDSQITRYEYTQQRKQYLSSLRNSYDGREKPSIIPSVIPIQPPIQIDDEEEVNLEHYEDYVDLLLQKFDLLMSLNQPWNLNEKENDKKYEDSEVKEGQQRILASIKKNISLVIEEKGIIPSSINELILEAISLGEPAFTKP